MKKVVSRLKKIANRSSHLRVDCGKKGIGNTSRMLVARAPTFT